MRFHDGATKEGRSALKRIAVAALLCGSMMFAQSNEPAGFHYWTRSDLDKAANGLAPQMDKNGFKTQILADAGNHRFQITHREAGGESEYHETLSDVVFVQSGRATLIYGGKMVDAKTTAPGEMRGTGIEGGKKQMLEAGDVVVIPSKLPHQFTPEKGAAFNYFVVKVADQ